MIAGIIEGALYLPGEPGRTGGVIATWPETGEGDELLTDIANQALSERRGVVRSRASYGAENKRICDLIASPLLVHGETVAVFTMMISIRSESQRHAVLQLLQWGGLWMETLIDQQSASRREDNAFTLSLVAAILGHSNSRAASMEAVNRLADHFQCERVSIGIRRGLPIRLYALSHVARFDPRTQLVRAIESAMEEAVDQTAILIQPSDPDREPAVLRAHGELAKHQTNGAVCTLPLPGQAGYIGAITLERSASEPFDQDTVGWCETVAGLIGPMLELKRREERSFGAKAVESFLALAAGTFGPTRLKLKLAVLSMVALMTVLSVTEGDYRVSALATVEGAVRQVLVAPQGGFVKEAKARAGDLVGKGELIARLDDRALLLESQKWQSERNKIEKEYQEALAKRDRTQLGILRALMEQAEAELRLVEDKITRTTLRAPFSGVVVTGDLSQSLGAPVETGQVLFEVAPLDDYRVVLEVDEHEVAALAAGMTGHMVVAALPQTYLPISVQKIVPVAVAGEGRNIFRVEASLDEPSSALRPGMQGVAKVDIGQRKLLWIWTHAVIDRVRLWAWSVGF